MNVLSHLPHMPLLLQVVATDHLSCHLLHHTCQLALVRLTPFICALLVLEAHRKLLALQEAGRGILAGSILPPELDLTGNHAQAQPGDKSCYMYLVLPEAIGTPRQGPAEAASCGGHLAPAMAQLQINGGSAQPDKLGTLMVSCQYPVAPERAMLWAQEMSSSVQASLTVVLGSIPVGVSLPACPCCRSAALKKRVSCTSLAPGQLCPAEGMPVHRTDTSTAPNAGGGLPRPAQPGWSDSAPSPDQQLPAYLKAVCQHTPAYWLPC